MSERTFRLQSRDVVAAFGALAIPTVATIFASDIEGWAGWAKWLTFAVWVLCAGFLVGDTLSRDRKIDQAATAAVEATAAVVQQREVRRREAIQMSLRRIFADKIEFPKKWDWTIYVYDEKLNLLEPAWPDEDPTADDLAEVKTFAPGQGATGQAFTTKRGIVRLGAEVHDSTHGLTDAQQKYFARRNAVVAVPIFADDDKTVIGVLAAIADDNDDYFDRVEHQDQLKATANVIGTLLEAFPLA